MEFPEWGIRGIEAKVDTGARTSAVHVDNVRRLHGNRVRFDVVLGRKNQDNRVEVEARILRMSRVRASTGHRQTRYVVAAQVRIGPDNRQIELSLVRREKMLCRMLLGRTALRGFLVDVDRRYVFGDTGRAKRSRRH